MRTISYKLDDLKKVVIPIGYEGENDYTRVIIDAGEVFKQYPVAAATLKVKPPHGTIYPVVVSREGDTVIWDVKETDCASNGTGEAQFTFTENSVIVKSMVTKININRSLVATGPAPDPIEDWLDTASETLEEANQAIEAATDAAATAEAAAGHMPYIGQDGYWYTWNGTEYVQGVKAQGEDGQPGQPGPKGDKGDPGDPEELIDDTDPAADKVFSSAKVDEELTDVKNAIQGLDDIDNLLIEEIPGTTKTVTFDANDNPSTITHSKNGTTVRTDTYTWGTNTVEEVRTLSTGKQITITTDLVTLASVISEITEVA